MESPLVAQDRVTGLTASKVAIDSLRLPEGQELRRKALEYLAQITQEEGFPRPHVDNEANGTPFSGAVHDEAEHDDLPENVYDLERMVSQVPRMRRNSAFHDTLNNDDAIRCPYVLSHSGEEGPGLDAVVHLGKAIAGHPGLVHGGITAMVFDNLFGWALVLRGTRSVFTASLKVDYKAPLPCLSTVAVNITIDRVEGRKNFLSARLRSLDKTVLYATAEALFIKPKPEQK